ncbi:hypothetical protein JOF28_000912 [Leucobacter exalbidus]|uniref:Uncharacterized protein n=1 Tax=Leucobacter exalbidus TaxID=662960 RepID=A0A940T092_9MICO|nr:hypothetical protein [Leucobacter exalbidus]MBP1325680.1 hypothetical protein [Leucobacter exalbidus]
MSETQPCVQIETDLWAVMRYKLEQPAAMIQCVTDRQQITKFLLMTWNPNPSQRRLIAMYDSLDAANAAVKWESAGVKTGRENHRWGGQTGHVPQSYRDGAPDVPTSV